MVDPENELFQEAQDDARCVAFIRSRIGQETQQRYTDDLLYYFLDVIADYYSESGVLEAEPGDDGCIEIDLEPVVAYMEKAARKDKMGDFPAEELLLIAQAELDYAEEEG